jgi:hypothetical protein
MEPSGHTMPSARERYTGRTWDHIPTSSDTRPQLTWLVDVDTRPHRWHVSSGVGSAATAADPTDLPMLEPKLDRPPLLPKLAPLRAARLAAARARAAATWQAHTQTHMHAHTHDHPGTHRTGQAQHQGRGHMYMNMKGGGRVGWLRGACARGVCWGWYDVSGRPKGGFDGVPIAKPPLAVGVHPWGGRPPWHPGSPPPHPHCPIGSFYRVRGRRRGRGAPDSHPGPHSPSAHHQSPYLLPMNELLHCRVQLRDRLAHDRGAVVQEPLPRCRVAVS